MRAATATTSGRWPPTPRIPTAGSSPPLRARGVRMATGPLESMPYALSAAGPHLFAALGDGQIYASSDRDETWERLPARPDAILALAAVNNER